MKTAMNILAFAASNSSRSINHQLVSYVLQRFKAEHKTLLLLRDFPLTIYGIDQEEEHGIPEQAIRFYEHIKEADVVLISLAEHNGSYTAVFKNLMDWLSRYKARFFEGKRVFLLSTSPGKRGGRSVMEAALNRFPRHGAEIIGHFSLPSFEHSFSSEEGLLTEELKSEFENVLQEISLRYGLEITAA